MAGTAVRKTAIPQSLVLHFGFDVYVAWGAALRNRSRNGVLDGPIDRGPVGVCGEAFLPEPRRQRGDVAGRMTLDALKHVDQVGVRIDALQPARNEQALEDPDVLRPDLRPAEQPVLTVMEISP